MKNRFCEPIDDPDCEDSDGINNWCLHCKNGLDIDVNFLKVVNYKVSCAEYAMLINSFNPEEIS